tara:strand:- start:1432 stop:1965 length:534 start_codon:yes stop_codon:yes gene_type:complete
MTFIFGFKCFNYKEIKAINKLIKKNLGTKEESTQVAENINKVGTFFNVSIPPIMNLIHPWLYSCQNVNRRHFGYDVDWQLQSDTVNYNVYGINDTYDWHIDERTLNCMDIKLTCLLNLSEEPYEGGEFYIRLQKEAKIKFDPGMGLVLHPLVAHKVMPVTKGKRKTLTYWALGSLWR